MRRLIALAFLGLLLAAAVGVLYTLGRKGLEAEAQRLEADARSQRREVLVDIRDELEQTLRGLLEREAARPYYHYRHLFLPPELVSNELALVPSPLSGISGPPGEPLVRAYLELREGQLTSPAFLTADLAHEEAPTDYAARIRRDLLDVAALEPTLRGWLQPSPGEQPERTLAMDAYTCQLNADPGLALEDLARSQYDPQAASKLKGEWSAYQGRQGNSPGNYQPPSQRMSQQAQVAEPTEVPVAVYPFRWLRAGEDRGGWPLHLLALRRIALDDGRTWLQGFLVDTSRLRDAVAPEVIAAIAPVSELTSGSGADSWNPRLIGKQSRLASYRSQDSTPTVALGPARVGDDAQLALAAPLETLALRHTTPPPDRRDLLTESRLLLDGSLALVGVVVLLGGLILVQAAVAERRLARQRSDFVAALTHELKAPLTGMRAMAELLRDGIVREETQRQSYYTSILGESERLSRLVQNVLDASRLERGAALETSIQTVDPAPLLRDLAASFRPRLETEGFAFEVDVDAAAPIKADPEAMLQIVANLLDNAFKYGRGATKHITLEALPAIGRLAIRVRDAGPGVPHADRERIFGRFFRSAASPSEVGGAGLGLAIARAQARAMGGELALEPHDRGACFRLELPLAEAA